MDLDIVLKRRGLALPEAPAEGMRYVVAENGVFLERRTPIFTTTCRVERLGGSLAPHSEGCAVHCPPLPAYLTRTMLGFFRWAYTFHGGEAALVILYDPAERHYRWHCPRQSVELWQSWSGRWHVSHDIEYDLPTVLPAGYVLLGDAHSHAHMAAYASAVDKDDEAYMDGLHLVVGCVDEKRPEFHLDFVMDGKRFPLEPSEFVGDAAVDPAPLVPRSWKQRVEVVRTPYVERRRGDAAQGGRDDGGAQRLDVDRPSTIQSDAWRKDHGARR
jgi:PRTRC genetic system protein A